MIKFWSNSRAASHVSFMKKPREKKSKLDIKMLFINELIFYLIWIRIALLN